MRGPFTPMLRLVIGLLLLCAAWRMRTAHADWVMTDEGRIEGDVRRVTPIGVEIRTDKRLRFVRSEDVMEVVAGAMGPAEAALDAFRAGRFTAAVGLLEQVERKVDQPWLRGRVRYRLMLAYLALGEQAKAKQTAANLLREDSVSIWLGLTPLPLTVSRWPDGIVEAATAAAEKSGKSHAAKCFAKAIASSAGKDTAVSLPKAYPDPYSGQLCRIAEAVSLLRRGDARDALAKLGPTDKYDKRYRAQAHLVHGLILAELKQPSEATLALLRAGYVYDGRELVAGPALKRAVDVLVAAGRKDEAGPIATDVIQKYPFARKMP